ncbi:V-type ATP synthase subunit I [Enterococcus moraviensis ATCC BAA-383]|uniref:V-type ATP synthase subunit I n=1 Tax=Enterococcus moraviensis ATCC BAA-383 TaxID=1158609 RepID=R2TKM9_9ENTE|nr:V-type ATP synthase subunit I [Enterococcus moraviensis]EOI00657.1 V-type ATP synthase subunit I [Enterococcus moraviensis ATCC BAA-383]EOT73114.1 V-type ATP synthase subunit I [Enterococcus moraviensis ATCC BAA-383]
MAVNKMEKITIIAESEKEEMILQAIQGMQAIEIKDFFHSNVDSSYIKKHFASTLLELDGSQKKRFQEMQTEIQEALTFIERYSEKTAKKKRVKRQTCTLSSLEKGFDAVKITGYLKEIATLKKKLALIETTRKDLLAKEKWLAHWQYLDIVPNKNSLESTELLLGSISSANQSEFLLEIEKISSVYIEEIYHSQNHVYYSLIYLKNMESDLDGVLNQYSFHPFEYPYDILPKEAYLENKEALTALVKEEKQVKINLSAYREHLEELYLAEEMTYALIHREEAKKHLLNTSYFFIMQGWIPVDEKQELSSVLKEVLPSDEVYMAFDQPTKDEIQSDIPVKLKNNGLVAPFEMLTEMYSLPKYDEIDPTPIMTPFYMVFFGMMVADIGYGLIMLLGALIALKTLVLPRGMKRFADFFLILSFPTIVWGFIYGSFFGGALPKILFGINLPFPILSTTEDVNTILILSVIFGFIQLLTGLMVNGIELTKRKRYLDSISESFAWQGLLIGILIVVLGMMLFDNDGLMTAGIIVAVISALSIVIVPIIQTKSKIKGVAKGLYNLYGVTGYIGDLVSYTRLMALGISGGSIAAAFNMLVAFMPPVARFTVGILLIIALHALNLFLSLLSAYVHGARLQYVEFFGKFYMGGGRAFNPLKTEEKYMNIEKKSKVKE